jgi:hypothetical protein
VNYPDLSDKELIDKIDNHQQSCTSWECDFIESCMTTLGNGRRLSSRQREKADQILHQLDSRRHRGGRSEA